MSTAPIPWAGMNINVTPDYHRKLSEDVPVTPEFRAEIDAWMRSFFKPHNIVPDGEILRGRDLWGRNVVYMNPRTFEQFKQRIEASNDNA